MKRVSNLTLLPGSMRKFVFKILILFPTLFFILNVHSGQAQTNNEVKSPFHFSGTVTATNNGISIIPSFSLGKPALMFELSVGTEQLRFDPQFRFSMEGKPWSFVFWWRYKFYESEKFRFDMGAHPAFMFVDLSYEDNGQKLEVIEARRYVAAEIAPLFKVSKNVTIMPYTLMAKGFDAGVKGSIYTALITNISNIEITEDIRLGLIPQLFFLKMDENHGYYFASAFSLSHKKFPVSLASMFNYKINSQIESKDFLWNVSLVYRFNKTFK